MFRAVRNETCYVRTYIVETASAEKAAEMANARWPYRSMTNDHNEFKAEEFKYVGTAFESSECLLPDH